MLEKVQSSTSERTVAVIGNPNTGKSTLFTALTGVHSRIGNYPGVTVEKKLGWFEHEGQSIRLVDLPGTYSLSPRTIDEMVSVDVLLGSQPDVGPLDAIVCIADASNLERNSMLSVRCWILDCRRSWFSTCGTWRSNGEFRLTSPSYSGDWESLLFPVKPINEEKSTPSDRPSCEPANRRR